MMGDAWPLSVDEITLYNHGGAIVGQVGNVFYAVNGWAIGGLKLLTLDDVWASDGSESRKDIGPLIQLGIALGDPIP